ncbi:hypothetical protein FOZ60_000761 [Perkinsus olseni]|uniref:Peptidase A1 domain-containing protein n=1 Tax=Perkinsus olseni TaxID=32597 RepID=A0A7J6P1N7_PEROL|nr:hypothetical protein FOZ60_000761 [Perkinsus olseni]
MILKPELSVAFGFLSLLVGSCGEKLVRMTISPQKTTAKKQWYERTHPGGCAELKFKCYDCDPSSCHEGPTKTHEFFGGSQLLAKPKSQRLIEESVFSVYLKTGKDPSGELILGGGDKSKYAGPLKYVKVVNKEEQSIMMPDKFKTPVLQLLRTAGKKPVTITESAGFYELSCGDIENLPSITFCLKEDSLLPKKVSLEIPPASYVTADVDSSSTLAIEFAGSWLLGLPTLIGNYHLYDWDKSRIGVAKVR